MANIPIQDLNYQPAVNPTFYSPPKLSFLQKILKLISSLLAIRKILKPLAKLSVIIFLLLIFFSAFLIALNYFNVLSLSYIYPQYFESLPHKLDTKLNASVLSGGTYSPDTKNWAIDATLYKVDNENVYIKYNKQIAVLKETENTTCTANVVTKIISTTQKELTPQLAFCSDVISNSNKGQNVTVVYTKGTEENYEIESINLE